MARKFLFQCMCYKNALVALILLSSIDATFCARPKLDSCNTPDCKNLTESIAASINWTARPCDDFYEHACGLWSHSQIIPTDAEDWHSSNFIMERVWHQLDGLLNEENYTCMVPLANKAKIAYEACKNLDKIEKTGIQDVLAVTEDVGGWPMIIPRWKRTNARDCWQKIHVKYGAMIGDGALLRLNVREDKFNHGKPTLYLDQPMGLFKGKNIMRNTEDENTYKKFVKFVVKSFAKARGEGKLDEETLKKDIDTLVQFRQRLKKIMTWGLKRHNISRMYNPKTIKNLEEWNAELNMKTKSVTINWKSFIGATIEYARHIVITEKQTVIIFELDYLANLLVLLADFDKEVIVNHIHLFFVENYLKNTGKRMRTFVSAIHHRHNTPNESNRWKTCLATHPMKHVLSLMYVKKYFPDSARDKLRTVFSNLQNTFIEETKKSSWLKNSVKAKAVKKLENIDFTIGYPDWYKNQTLIIKYYDGQEVTDAYFFNVLSYERTAYRREIEKLVSMNYKDDLDMYPIDMDIAYVITKNSIYVSAAAMQLPFFSQQLPSVLLYSTTGYILGHELSHAFDQIGKLYDEQGLRADWWDENTSAEYDKRVQCIIDKYSKFPIKKVAPTYPMLRLYAAKTADEDFADNQGLHMAFKSYKNASGEGKVSSQIPALGRLAENKIFFYAFAQLFCRYSTKDAILYLIESDVHSLSHLRVNGPLSNSPEFSAAFDCPTNSFMNSQNKCSMWDK